MPSLSRLATAWLPCAITFSVGDSVAAVCHHFLGWRQRGCRMPSPSRLATAWLPYAITFSVGGSMA
ncbi:hypothetical protein [Chloroflexus sp.]|uniref:hypothetical protein n=1 Tax=Chloroflexus sp. TaxID=1904827 RepID=UPI00258B4E9D|nr:hypothetical protein [Chloroflexus sp.]